MQGGLVSGGQGVSITTAGGPGGGAPAPTGAPPIPGQSQQSQYAQTQTQTTSGGAGQGPGVSTDVQIGEMGPIDRLLAGSDWNREDVELVLQTISTLLLLYWALTEVQR